MIPASSIPIPHRDLSLQLLEIIYSYGTRLPSEKFSEIEKRQSEQALKVFSFLQRHAPIHLVLPAFPAKSPNPQKTFGPMPDLGEFLGLKRLEQLCEAIKPLYPPGAKVTICSDGRVFSDLVRVSDTRVDAYSRSLRQMVESENIRGIDFFNLEDFFKNISYTEMREALEKEFAKPIEIVRDSLHANEDGRQLFNGIHRFLFEDQVVLDEHLSRSKVRAQSKDTTYQVIRRSNAWSQLVSDCFPEALRLSIHPQPAHSEKIGIQLVPSPSLWRTPWHSVVLMTDVGPTLMPRHEAERTGAQLKTHSGYQYFSKSEKGESIAFY